MDRRPTKVDTKADARCDIVVGVAVRPDGQVCELGSTLRDHVGPGQSHMTTCRQILLRSAGGSDTLRGLRPVATSSDAQILISNRALM